MTSEHEDDGQGDEVVVAVEEEPAAPGKSKLNIVNNDRIIGSWSEKVKVDRLHFAHNEFRMMNHDLGSLSGDSQFKRFQIGSGF